MAKKQHITQCTTTEEDVYILYIIVIKSDIFEVRNKSYQTVFLLQGQILLEYIIRIFKGAYNYRIKCKRNRYYFCGVNYC